MPSALLDYPVAVPDKIFGLTLFLDFIDRCHSLGSLHLPQVAQRLLLVDTAGPVGVPGECPR